jgi:heterodisulfide reductase subunit B
LTHNDELRDTVNEKLRKIGRAYKGNVKVKHFVRILYEDVGPEKIKSQVKKSLEGLKFASHYGCHYLKPSEVFDSFEDPEFPRTLDALISVLGAETIEYEDKTQCCGGVILDVDDKTALAMAQKKLDHISSVGADAMVLMCPLCGSMYDRNQRVIERRFKTAYNLPVLFYPQVLGLALGIDPKGLGLDMNRVKTSDLLTKLRV